MFYVNYPSKIMHTQKKNKYIGFKFTNRKFQIQIIKTQTH